MKKLLIIVFAMLIGSFAFAERPPMYAGGVIGLDTYGYGGERAAAFGMEPVFGIRPLPLKNMGFELGLHISFPAKHNYKGYSYKTSYWGMSTKFFYDFKAFSALPKMNAFVYGGLGFISAKEKDEYGYGTDFEFTSPIGAGLKYQILDHLEAVLKTEVIVCEYWGFNILTGVNYTF
jgi:hypothetical protein